MATATVARPGQSLRNRRDTPRPTLAKRTATAMDGITTADTTNASKKRKLTEPFVRDSAFILRKHAGKPPSLTLHLYQPYFKFEGQDGSFSYDSPMRFILEHVKKQTVPHKMMEELLQSNVAFYDGCLIVEVHNHRGVGKDKGRHESGVDGDVVKFGLHNYNPHVTPSPFVPYPSKAKEDRASIKAESAGNETTAAQKSREKDDGGPKISTVVLHPTDLTRHEEMKILANTPAAEARAKKKAGETTATPSTPSATVPPTPSGQAARPSGSQKMCLEEGDFYTFQADMLMATTEPLFLEPCGTPHQSDAIIDMLQHPNHQESPPSPKERKRTTAEVAADDAQAAEIERRMLIMDERIKATGTGNTTGEAQGATNAMQFQRFKTIDMVRQKHEEAERARKDEEARKAMEKKEADEQQAQQQKMIMAQRRNEMMMAAGHGNQQQLLIQQQQRRAAQQAQQAQAHAQAQAAQAQQQALMNAQNHAHPSHNGMGQNQQQNNQQANQASMAPTSPIVRQQTPMVNSSPMMPQGGFPMAQTSSQGPGSPPRPTSAMQHPMARQISQQQRASQGGQTPHVAQGTPRMAQAVPNRQMSQTPRLGPNSPAMGMPHGTPVTGTMQTPGLPQQSQLTPAQVQILEHRQQSQNAGNIMPDQFQNISNMQRQQHMQAMQRNMQNNPQQLAAMQARQQQQRQMQMQQHMLQQRNQQQLMARQNQMQHAGSPGAMQTPQMAHGHPQPQQGQQGMTNAQRAQMSQQMNMQIAQSVQPLIAQFGGILNIPQNVIATLSPPQQTWLRRSGLAQQQQIMRAQAQRGQMAGGQGGGGEQVPGGPGDPQYMAALRQQQQQMLGQMQQQQQGGGGGMNGMAGMNFQMSGGNPGQGQGQQQNFGGGQGQQQGDALSAQFLAMQNALNRGQ